MEQMPKQTTYFKRRLLIIVIGSMALIGFLTTLRYAYGVIAELRQKDQVACTMDAMLCPDGSSVGRVGPNCEFAPCPTVGQQLPAEIREAYDWPIKQVCIDNSGYVVYYQLDDGSNIYTYKGAYVRGRPVICTN